MEAKKHEYSKHRLGWPKEDTPNVNLFTFTKMGYDLSEAMDMHSEWTDAHGGPQFEICTNNHYEAELEEEWIRDREFLYYGKDPYKKKKASKSTAKRKRLTQKNDNIEK